MVAAAAIGAVSTVVGAGSSIIAGNKAAKATKNAAKQASDTERYMYDTTRADYAPYREVGYGALGKLAGMTGVQRTNADGTPVAGGVAGAMGLGYANDGGFTASPGYQFRMDEGQKAIERSAASRGLLKSGASLKALTRFAQGTASDEFNNYANRLAALAGVGQSATGSTAAAGSAAANAISQNQIAAGNARASSYANTGAAINNGVTNLASAYLLGGRGGGFGSINPYGINNGGGGIY